MSTKLNTLKGRWEDLLSNAPKTRIRDAAKALDVSEADLLATQLGDGVTRLKPEFEAILKAVPTLGKVMALTRNDAVVIEKTGPYNAPEFFSHGGPSIGQVVGPEIDLRLFMHAWAHAFAVEKEMRGKLQRSLQFFDEHGTAIHKIYLRDKYTVDAYNALVSQFAADEQSAPSIIAAEPTTAREASTFDEAALLEEWRNMTNTHQFFHMLRKYEVHRLDALAAAEGEFAWRVDTDTHRKALQKPPKQGCRSWHSLATPVAWKSIPGR